MPQFDFGFVESSHQLVATGREWSQQKLLTAAERAQLRNTGWPLGVVLTGRGEAPIALSDGIECRVHRDQDQGGPGWEDYWRFQTDGSYYVARVFEEEFGESGSTESRKLWFDIRIRRIAEAILHSAELYRALEVAPTEQYVLAVSHHGLRGRRLAASRRGFAGMGGQWVSQEDSATWQRQLTQDVVHAELNSIVAEIAQRLFVLFEFPDIPATSINAITEKFLAGRI